MNRASSALCNAATVFRAGQACILPDSPKQRRIRFDIDINRLSINCEVCHRDPLSSPIHRSDCGGEFGLEPQAVQINILRLGPAIIALGALDILRYCGGSIWPFRRVARWAVFAIN
jgi:hypothetical protein